MNRKHLFKRTMTNSLFFPQVGGIVETKLIFSNFLLAYSQRDFLKEVFFKGMFEGTKAKETANKKGFWFFATT